MKATRCHAKNISRLHSLTFCFLRLQVQLFLRVLKTRAYNGHFFLYPQRRRRCDGGADFFCGTYCAACAASPRYFIVTDTTWMVASATGRSGFVAVLYGRKNQCRVELSLSLLYVPFAKVLYEPVLYGIVQYCILQSEIRGFDELFLGNRLCSSILVQ